MSSDRFFVKNRTKSRVEDLIWAPDTGRWGDQHRRIWWEKRQETRRMASVSCRFLSRCLSVCLSPASFFFFLSSRLFITSLASLIPSLSGTCVTMENCHTRSPIFASVTLHHLISLKKVEVWTYRLPGVLLSRFYTAAVPYVYLHFSEFWLSLSLCR